MASILLPISAITLLLFFLSSTPTNAGVIVDMDGEPLKNGGQYYILPHKPDPVYQHGGLGPTPMSNTKTCPLYVWEQLDTLGTPTTISSNARIAIITSGLTVQFTYDSYPTTCNDPLRWWVAKPDQFGDRYILVGTPGPFKPTYFFKIEEAEKGKNVYKIKFCHVLSFENLGKLAVVDEECHEVGMGKGRLAVDPYVPYPVTFKKVESKVAY